MDSVAELRAKVAHEAAQIEAACEFMHRCDIDELGERISSIRERCLNIQQYRMQLHALEGENESTTAHLKPVGRHL